MPNTHPRDGTPVFPSGAKSFTLPNDPVADGTPPAGARQMRQRLLERVADDDDSHLTINADDGTWQPFVEGVHIKVLRKDGDTMSYLLRLEPGTSLPAHRHRIDEECIVLEGQLQVGSHTEVGAGGFHLAHAGALHPTVSTRTGATIYLRGAVPHKEDVLG